jgi:hypothetical protein
VSFVFLVRSASSFKPNLTHVLLVALFLVTMSGLEAIRAEVAKSNKKKLEKGG